jgi:hypothetical protein
MRLIYWYLKVALFFGFTDYVYNLSSRWGSFTGKNPHRYNAAWEIQKDLLKRGFHECPSCLWATREEDEHINRGEGYCYEQTVEVVNHQMLLDQLGENPMTWQ